MTRHEGTTTRTLRGLLVAALLLAPGAALRAGQGTVNDAAQQAVEDALGSGEGAPSERFAFTPGKLAKIEKAVTGAALDAAAKVLPELLPEGVASNGNFKATMEIFHVRDGKKTRIYDSKLEGDYDYSEDGELAVSELEGERTAQLTSGSQTSSFDAKGMDPLTIAYRDDPEKTEQAIENVKKLIEPFLDGEAEEDEADDEDADDEDSSDDEDGVGDEDEDEDDDDERVEDGVPSEDSVEDPV